MKTSTLIYKTGSQAQLPTGIFVGSHESLHFKTGCTVILAPDGAICGVDVRGAAPATRESDLLRPSNMIEKVHAVVLSGGSAFGLAAADGVMAYCESKRIGLEFAGNVVPIVVGACLFDLGVGDGQFRPDAEMGFKACLNAYIGKGETVIYESMSFEEKEDAIRKSTTMPAALENGRIGAGCGASVGKLLGPEYAMSGGLGTCSTSIPTLDGELIVGAVVAVNAVGNIVDTSSGRILAGAVNPLTKDSSYMDAISASLLAMQQAAQKTAGNANEQTDIHMPTNTTLACVITNAKMDKCVATRVATMAHDGYARAIEPVHTSNDGDAIYCMSTNSISANPDFVGMVAANVIEKAIHNAVADSVPLH